MALIGRLFVVFFAFLAACFVAGMIVVGAVLYPEFSDLGGGEIDQSAINVLLGFGFIFLSGFALLPALIVVLITEAFYIRSVLAYAVGGAIVGAACYLGLIPFDPGDAAFRRHRAPPSRDHDRRGHRGRPDLLDDRGPIRRRLARTSASLAATAAVAVALTAAGVTRSCFLPYPARERNQREPFHPQPPRLNPAP